jgi:hypothetical protein
MSYDINLLSHIAATILVNDPNVRAGTPSPEHAAKAVEVAKVLLDKCNEAINPPAKEPEPAPAQEAHQEPHHTAHHKAAKHK